MSSGKDRDGGDGEQHICHHRDHDDPEPAVAEFEGIVQPDGAIRFKACEEHASDIETEPLRYFDAGDGNSRLLTDGGQQVQTVSADFLTGSCPNCEEPAQEPVEFVPREIECTACGEIWRLVQ